MAGSGEAQNRVAGHRRVKQWRLSLLIGATVIGTIALTAGALALVPSDPAAHAAAAIVSAQVTPSSGLAVFDCPSGTAFTTLPPGVIVHWLGNESGASDVPAGWALVDYNAAGTPLLASPPTILPFDAFHAHVTGWVQASGIRLSAATGRVLDTTMPQKVLDKCRDGSAKAIAPPAPSVSSVPAAVLGNFLSAPTTTTTAFSALASEPASTRAASNGAGARSNGTRQSSSVTESPPTTLPPIDTTSPVSLPPRPITVPTTVTSTTVTSLVGSTRPSAGTSTSAATTTTTGANSTTTEPVSTTTTQPRPFAMAALTASPSRITTVPSCAGMETVSQVSVQLTGGAAPYTVLLVYSVADQLAQVPMVNPAQAGAAGTWYASIPISAIPRSLIGGNGQTTVVLQAKAIDAAGTTTGLIDAGLLIVRSC